MFVDEYIKHLKQFNYDESSESLKILLSRAVRYQIDNVANYIQDMKDKMAIGEAFPVDKKIPNVAPLAPLAWFEYNHLTKKPVGCLIYVAYDSKAKWDPHKFGEYYSSRYVEGESTRWILQAYCFSKESSTFYERLSYYHILVNDDGEIVGKLEYSIESGEEVTYKYGDEPIELAIIAPLTAICFAHCKGTEIAEHQPSRQVRRQAERKGEPVYTYRTIDIHPSARVLKEEGDIEHNGLGKALHICRGNFAHYTPEKPLFGKYVGTVYRPMHMRGKAENGIVEKDYRVHAE